MLNINKYRLERAIRHMEAPRRNIGMRIKLRILGVAVYVLLLSAIIYGVCFSFGTVEIPPVITSKITKVHIVSPFDFYYKSEFLTQQKRDRSAERIPPLYKISDQAISNASKRCKDFVSFMDENQEGYSSLKTDADRDLFFENVSSKTRTPSILSANPDDVKTIFENTTPATRGNDFRHAYFELRKILHDGVYADGDAIFSHEAEIPSSDVDSSLMPQIARAQSQTSARLEFLRKIKTIGVGDQMAMAMYRILNQLIEPNIEFDAKSTLERRNAARAKIPEVVVNVREGEIVFDSSEPETKLSIERNKAYRIALAEHEKSQGMSAAKKYTQFVVSFLLVLSATLFIMISRTPRNRQPKTIATFSILLVLNLVAERIVIGLTNSEYFDSNTTLLQLLTYCSPIMVGPIIQVLLFGPFTGFIMAILITALTTIIIGAPMVFFVLFFSSALLAIYFCDGARSRSWILLGGVIYGLFIAVFTFVIGFAADIPLKIMGFQALTAVIWGVLTGLVSIIVLPIVEKLSGRYSNIALIDYTDINNKKSQLLSELQIKANGTYHHCVAVANIAEAAARAVHANAMVCRVGGLYHDIGKITKPEYFNENQSDGRNPHDNQSPSMSAFIIRDHTIGGVALAKANHLPPQIIDAIDQHHGTSMIAYFYNKAVKLAESRNPEDVRKALREMGVEEECFRHVGRKPQTVENAIIMIADSCEAASRSLKKVTQHRLESLVEAIVRGKMNDGQFDECPITVKQIDLIKKSIVFSLMNMLHSRLEYNNAK